MKILFIVPNPPSLVRVRPYNLVKYLAARGHQVTLATVWSSREEARDIERLKSIGFQVVAVPLGKRQILQNLLAAAVTGRPLQASYCDTPALRGMLAQHLNGQRGRDGSPFDVVHVEHLRGAQYGLLVQECTSDHPLPVVWDSVDCISHLFRQAATRSRSRLGRAVAQLELRRTQRYEGRLVSRFDQVLVTSDTDKQALCTLSMAPRRSSRGQAPIAVLPNGVDLDYFTCNTGDRDPATLLFSGKMSYHANVTAAFYLVEEIMPQVWRHQPEAKAVIAGKDPPPALRRLGETLPNVEVTGTVPDLRPYLWTATVAVSPVLYGAGIQNKVLEAMACGTPVVASAQAASALLARHGEQLLLADTTEAFVQQVLRLLSDRTMQRCLGASGRTYVETYHHWDGIAGELEQLYHQVIERKRAL